MSDDKKEQVYDELISPHMLAIIEICREHDIGLVSVAELDTDVEPGGETMFASTSIPPKGQYVSDFMSFLTFVVTANANGVPVADMIMVALQQHKRKGGDDFLGMMIDAIDKNTPERGE